MPRPRKKADETSAAAVMEAVKNLKPEDVHKQVGDLQTQLQGTLAALGASIAGKVEQMQNVDEAIKLKAEELKELHDIDAMQATIEDLAREYREKEEDLSKSLDARRAAWKEENEERMKKWQREQEEHEYNLTQMLRKKQDEVDAAISNAKRAEAVRQEDLTREWQSREDEISSKEDEIKALKEEVAGIEERIKSEVSRAEKITENSIKRNYEHQIALMKKDSDAAEQLHEAEIRSLKAAAADMQQEVVQLRQALEAARTDAKEVTAAALESASGRRVTEALQKVVDSTSLPNAKTK